MRLLGMVEALKTQEQDPSARELSFQERFGRGSERTPAPKKANVHFASRVRSN